MSNLLVKTTIVATLGLFGCFAEANAMPRLSQDGLATPVQSVAYYGHRYGGYRHYGYQNYSHRNYGYGGYGRSYGGYGRGCGGGYY
jgi:hypothetical protein